MRTKKIAALLLAAMFLLLAACGSGGNESLPPPASSGSSSQGSEALPFPEVDESLKQAQAANSDVKGWLYVPGTTISEAVVQTGNNSDYLRRNLKKGYSYAGSLFFDYRSPLAELGQNTIIYGHNLGSPWGVKDNPDGEKFAQLLKFADEEFAKKNPYLYLQIGEQKLVFQIFAVFYAEAYTKPVEYHHSSFSTADFSALLNDVQARSLYQYEGKPTAADKLLTLSTCTYRFGTYSQNPDQRFVVMGRLVKEGASLPEEASFTVNPAPKAPQFS